MKWRTFASKIDEWQGARRAWHSWYAWHPVVMKAGWNVDFSDPIASDEWIWGETIERRNDDRGNWEYRAKRLGEGENNG